MSSNQSLYEPLTDKNSKRYQIFPLDKRYEHIWKLYKKQFSNFWSVEEIDFGLDEFDKLTPNEQKFIKNILAFFAASDGIVNENIQVNFLQDIEILEIKVCYEFQVMIENVHCVSGNTNILTDKGYFNIESLINKNINVWNGEQFAPTQVKYTGNQALYNVCLSNGMELDCTDGHKWFIRTGNQKHPESCKMTKIETQHLNIGDVIYDYQLPIIDMKDIDNFKNPYIHGFFCGDGSYCNKYPIICLYDKKMELLEYFNVDNISKSEKYIRFYITKKINKNKYYVPINYSIETKLRWLEGYCDADGTINLNPTKDATSIQIGSINKKFLQDIQLLLTTLGINTYISFSHKAGKRFLPKNDGTDDYTYYDCKDCFTIYISTTNVNKLIDLGFSPKRLQIKYCSRIINGVPKARKIKITKITKISDDERTYCFTEPLNSAGIFNGILTGQSETYSLLIDTYITDSNEKLRLLNAIEEIPTIQKKANWVINHINNKSCSLSKRLVIFTIVEGVMFQGSFCAIFWLKKRGLMPGLTFSNELISRDEGMHTDFGVELYRMSGNKLTQDEIEYIFREAVDIEIEFICESVPCGLIGMNSDLMTEYIKFVADRLILQLGYNKIYNARNPFDFMEFSSVRNKTNFFEKKVSEYNKAGVMQNSEENAFSLDADF